MINEWAKSGLYFVGGGLVSGVVTYLLTKRYYLKKHEELIQEEVAEVKAHYKKVIEQNRVSLRNEVEKDLLGSLIEELGYTDEQELRDEVDELDDAQNQSTELHEEYLEDFQSPTKTIWQTPQLTEEEYENGVGIDPEPDEEVKEGWAMPKGVNFKEPPYPFTIERSSYYEDESDYDKLTLVFYSGDKVLADSRDEVIDDVEGTIGPDALESFGHLSDDPNVCYVRNRSREADFEIVRDDRSWSKVVYGSDDESRDDG